MKTDPTDPRIPLDLSCPSAEDAYFNRAIKHLDIAADLLHAHYAGPKVSEPLALIYVHLCSALTDLHTAKAHPLPGPN